MSGIVVEGIAVEGMVLLRVMVLLLRGMALLWNEMSDMVEVKESQTMDSDI